MTFIEINVDEMPESFGDMVKLTGSRSCPQILINGVPIGGYDNLLVMVY